MDLRVGGSRALVGDQFSSTVKSILTMFFQFLQNFLVDSLVSRPCIKVFVRMARLHFSFSDARARLNFSMRTWGAVSGRNEDWTNP